MSTAKIASEIAINANTLIMKLQMDGNKILDVQTVSKTTSLIKMDNVLKRSAETEILMVIVSSAINNTDLLTTLRTENALKNAALIMSFLKTERHAQESVI